jgi:hypothetical protein
MIKTFDTFDFINEAKSNNTAIVFTCIDFNSSDNESTLMGCYIKALLTINKVKFFHGNTIKYYAEVVSPLNIKKCEEVINNVNNALKDDIKFAKHYTVSKEFYLEEYSGTPFLQPLNESYYILIRSEDGSKGWRLQISNI